MLIQTADRVHARAMHERQEYWPRNALDLWWRAARRAPDPELLALRMLDHWRAHATFHCARRLNGPWLQWFLEETEAFDSARVLDRLSVSVLTAISAYRRLRANYSGPAFRVNNATDIGLIGSTADIATLLALGGTNVVDTGYDQSGSGFANYVAATTARPRITNSGTLDTTTGGVPTFVFDGSNDQLAGPSNVSYGLAAGSAITVGLVAKWAATGNFLFSVGEGDADAAWRFELILDAQVGVDLAPGTDRALYNVPLSCTTADRSYIVSKALNADIAHNDVYQNGVLNALTTGTGSGTDVLNMTSANAATRWGAVSNSVGAAAGFFSGRSNFYVMANTTFTAPDREALFYEEARHL